jgi:hypothetical protein
MTQAENFVVGEIRFHVLKERKKTRIGGCHSRNPRLVPFIQARIQEKLFAIDITQEA